MSAKPKKAERARIILLMGTTGSGKTYKMNELMKDVPRVFLFDLMADKHFENWGVLCEDCESAVHLARQTEKFHIRMQFAEPERFNFMCKLLVKRPMGHEAFPNTLIVVDEIAMFCSPQWMPESLSDLVRLGRHTNAQLIATTQRPPDIHPFIRSQAKEWYLFQMHEERDLDVFKRRVPNVEQLINLQQGAFILWLPQQMKKSSLKESTNILPDPLTEKLNENLIPINPVENPQS